MMLKMIQYKLLQKPFSLEFLLSKIEGRMLNKRVIGEQEEN